jgi:transcriptional regulator with XRE-family HTH domain
MGRSNRIRPKRLGEKLKQIRNSLGLSQSQMIKQLDYQESSLHSQNISGFETGEREPNLIILLAYARLVGIGTDVLIDDNLDLPKKLPLK